MARKPTSGMRLLCIGLFLLWGLKPAFSQNPFYEVYGPLDINLCSLETNIYSIETSEQLERTDWTIIPNSNVFISPDTYFAQIQFFAPGTYTLIASSTTINGVLLVDSVQIYVFGLVLFPEVIGCYESDSLSGCYQVCAFSHTTINLLGAQLVNVQVTGADSYTLSNSNGSIDILWGAGGDGTVTFFSPGCDFTLCFEIFPEPTADFSATPPISNDTITVCKHQEILFENQSFNGLSHTWNFGDGSLSQSYDASHAYSVEGFYTVSLVAESICDCSDQKQIVVEVLPAPAPTLDCINSVCPETRQRYIATTTGCTVYNWTVSPNGTIVHGGGLADDFIEVIWHEGPDGYIDLSVSGCSTAYCSFTNRFRIPIISPDGPIKGDESVCSGQVSTYTAPYFPGTQYQWQVGPAGAILGEQNKNGVTIQWNDVNVATSSFVEVTYDNCFLECGGRDVLPVMITPEITLIGDVQVCQDASASVQAQSGFGIPVPASVYWQLEDESGLVLVTAGPSDTWNYSFTLPPGIYTWVALNFSLLYCTEMARLDIEVTEKPLEPLGILGETEICPGQPYGYTIDGAGSYTTLWTITDGASTFLYSGQTCQHTFGAIPPYKVEAVHADIQYIACTSDPVSLVLSSAADLTIFGPDEVCFNDIDSFSTDYISGTDYVWEIIPADHGEIRNSNLNQVEVFWTQSGAVTLRLNACGVVIDKNIVVHTLPSFNLVGPTAACANETVNLTTSQSTLLHQWRDEHDGIIGILDNVDLAPGSYAVEVTDLNGCASALPFQITSYPSPSVHLSTASSLLYCVTIPGGVNIVANTDGADYSYEWYLDDVSIGPGGPVYNVTAFGSYHVKVTNQYGCTTVSLKIKFENCCPPDVCGAGVPGNFPGCLFLSHNFTIAASETECQTHQYTPLIAGITPGSVQWFIESSSEGLLDVVNSDVLEYTYTHSGYYDITMLGLLNGFPYTMTLCGHFENLTDTIRAVTDFKHEGICAGTPVLFEDLTTFLPAESIASWAWDFGDPASGAANTSALQDPDHLYAAAGNYEVTLTITLASGCSSIKKRMVQVSAGPLLSPVFDPLYCEDEAMAFHLPGQVFDIIWDFGDPSSGAENTASSDSVFHTFALAGPYTILVTASDVYQCRSQASFPVDIIVNTLSGLIDVNPVTPLCAGDTAVLTAPTGGVSWLWSNDESTSSIHVTESNQYNVLIRDQYHCTYSPPAVFVEVFPKPEVIIKAREIYSPGEYGPWSSVLNLCYGTEFEISAFSTGNVSYHWSTGEVTQVIQFTSEGGNLPGPGINEYTVVTTDLVSNCVSDSSLIQIEIYDLPLVPVISNISGNACSFNDNILQVSNPEAGIIYQWSDGQTGALITVTEAGLYFVEAINMHGCTRKSNTLLIRPSAPVDQIPGGCFVKCDPLSVCLPPISGVVSYSIFKDGNLFLSGNAWPSDFQISDDGSYVIEVTTANGCTATSDPLDVILYTGVGSITVLTYFDTDGDGSITGADALLPNIPVQIISDDGLQTGMTETESDGAFVFEDYPSTNYTALFDRLLLPSQYQVVIDSVATTITTCGDSVVVSLLLKQNCTVSGPDQWFELCPGEILMVGDSSWSDTGSYAMHILSTLGCDSVFNVVIRLPDSIVIGATVWVDVDQNGIWSPADTVIQGITIVIDHLINQAPFIEITDVNGMVNGTYDAGAYLVSVDSTILPPGLEVIYGSNFISDTVCGQAGFNFLLGPSCADVLIIQQETICPGDSILVQGQWIDDAGVYSITLSEPGSGCDTILDVYVDLYPGILYDVQVSWNCISYGTIELNLTGTAPLIIDWGQPNQGDTLLTGMGAGEYYFLITDGNGCSVIDTAEVTESALLNFMLQDEYAVTSGDSVGIEVTGDVQNSGLHFQWSPAGIVACDTCFATYAFPLQNTLLQISITDADSCVYLLETNIVVNIDSSTIDHLYAPNVFTPNGDDVNDRWTLYSRLDNTYVNELSLFDRWGTLIFYKKEFILNTFDGWDGTFRGELMHPNVFAYMADVTLGDGQRVRIKGDVTLVR